MVANLAALPPEAYLSLRLSMAAPIPKKIGKYDVIDVVGRGGMGVVYRAKDPFLDRMVAIKIMTISYTDQPDLLQRFYREAKATANLQHPNIVTVYELGEHEGSPYLAMQYLEGASLDSILRSGQPLSLLQKIDIIIEACHGLSYAHQKGIVHRDIKPGNIMVLKDSSVKIVDFGIARIGDTNFTRTGQFMGSLNYMSLEQLNDKLQVDQRTDVYSTGVVLYQIITGCLPFEADSTGATLMKILNENPAPFSKYLSSFPPEIETITLKALAKDRDQRYSSADELALDLTQLADRLKHDQIDHHMQQAEVLVQQNNLFQANDQLMAVLKLDKQNTKAAAMLRTLRKQIEKEQSSERARQLREQAEEALSREDFDPALGFIEQAIHLDANNTDFPQLKNKIQAAKAEIDHLRQVMQRAENAHRAGNLDTAKQAIEEVLERRPNDTRVKSLHRMIQKELDERMRQKRLETLLETARKEMANRRYTVAFDLLKEAEKVDPDAPTVRSLLETLTAARDQEQKRRELEQLTRQIEQALNTDDPQAALNFLADGLKRFPAEPALLKLKDLADSQHQAAQVKSFVRERIAAAREILNAGNATGALKVLQEALKKAPGNPHLESLVSIAQERLTQDRDDQAKSRCIQQANEALSKRTYADAIRILEAGQVQFTASPEIDNLLRFAREQQAKDAKKQDVENSVRRAQEFLKNQEYDRAIALLESIIKSAPDEELSIVLEEARRRREALNNQIAAALARGRQFLDEGSPAKAVEFLQAQPTAYRRSDQFRELVQSAMSSAAKEQEAAALAQPVLPQPVLPEVDEFDAPDPSKTMMWNTMGPPVEEERGIEPPRPEPPRPIPPPRIPTGRVTPVSPAPVAKTGFLQRLTMQQKLLAGGGIGVLLLIVLLVVLWPTSKPVVPAHKDPFTQPDHPPQPPPPVATGSLTVQTNVDSVQVFVDNDAPRVTSGKQLEIPLSVGDHTIRVSKDGYNQLAAQSFHIDKDQEQKLPPFTLVELTGHPGFLQIIKSTPGASVHVDSQLSGVIQQDGTLKVQVTPKNRYFIQIDAGNANPWKMTVGPVKADQTLPVSATLTLKPLPTVDFFSGSSTEVSSGQTVKITWSTKNAKVVDIDNGVGSSLSPASEAEVKLDHTTTYTLTAKGDGGTSSKTLTVTVKAVAAPKAPVISSFAAASARIKQGDSVTLNWSTTDATSVTLNGNPQPAEGSLTVKPSDDATYTLVANGAANLAPASKSVTVAVDKAPAPPPPTAPTTDPTKAATPLVRDALDRLTKSYANQIVDDVRKEWTGMTRQDANVIQKQFNSSGWKSVSVEYDPCTGLSVTDDKATIHCIGTTWFTKDGKRQVAGKVPFAISLKKAGDIWRVDTVVYSPK